MFRCEYASPMHFLFGYNGSAIWNNLYVNVRALRVNIFQLNWMVFQALMSKRKRIRWWTCQCGRSEVKLKYFVYVAEMKDSKLCFDHHHIWYRSLIVLWNIAIIFYLLNFLCIPCNFNAGVIYSVRKVMTISYWSDRWKVMSPIIWNNIKQVPINKNLMK